MPGLCSPGCRLGMLVERTIGFGCFKKSKISEYTFSKALGHCSFSSRRNFLHTEVCASADYFDSNPDFINYQREHDYHPLESMDYDSSTKEKPEITLTTAEIARTIVEMNKKAIIMSHKMLLKGQSEKSGLSSLQYHYVTDEYGDIYFQAKDTDILQSISTSNSPVHCMIGLESMDALRREESAMTVNNGLLYSEPFDDTDSDDEELYDEFWNRLVSIIEEIDESEIQEPLGGWTSIETMKFVDPMEFSTLLAEVASTDYSKMMDYPSKGLLVVGLIRPAFAEEQVYVKKFLHVDSFKRERAFSSNNRNEEFEESEFDSDTEIDPRYQKSLADSDGILHELENEKTSIYKMEILKLHLLSLDGSQSAVSLEDFQQAEPDVLSHSASKIISRINACGEKAKVALKSLCKRVKGIHVEEATLIGIDSLGIDVRVRFATQLQTLRFPFDSQFQATSEFAAERQLRHLLFPQFRCKRRKKPKSRHQES